MSATIPTIVLQGPGDASDPYLIRRPSGVSRGQNWRAIVSLMTTTAGEVLVSASVTKRPASTRMPMTFT